MTGAAEDVEPSFESPEDLCALGVMIRGGNQETRVSKLEDGAGTFFDSLFFFQILRHQYTVFGINFAKRRVNTRGFFTMKKDCTGNRAFSISVGDTFCGALPFI
jgi:hypothetical protein